MLVTAVAVGLALALAVPAIGASAVEQGVVVAKKKCKKAKKGASAAKKKCKKKKKAPQQTPPPTPPAPASLTISPDNHDFGTVPVPGGESPSQTFTVTNTGGTASGTLVTALSGSAPANFPTSEDTCGGTSLAPSSSCTLGAKCVTSGLADMTWTATLTVGATPAVNASASLTCFQTT